jgi:hypothetical protein
MAFPADPLNLLVEAAFGADLSAAPASWTWSDLTSRTRVANGINITKGQPDEANRAGATTLKMQWDASDGTLMPLNPTSPYWPNIRENVPIRVTVNEGAGGVRALCFADTYGVNYEDATGTNVTVALAASGIRRRLGQGRAAKSALRRTLTGANTSTPTGYWALEDGTDAAAGASALVGGSPAVLAHGAVFGSALVPAGSAGAADVTVGIVTAPSGQVAGSAPGGWEFEVTVGWVDSVPVPGASALAVATALCPGNTSGAVQVGVGLTVSGGKPYWASLIFDATGSGSAALLPGLTAVEPNRLYHLRVKGWQSGGNLRNTVWVDGYSGFDDGFAGTLSMATAVRVNVSPDADRANVANPSSVSHLAFYAPFRASLPDTAQAAQGFPRELVHVRLARLCAEESVPFETSATYSQACGPQPVGTLLAVLDEATDIDRGILYDGGANGGFTYVGSDMMMNQSTGMTVPWGDLDEQVQPVMDDFGRRSDMTVTRPGGQTWQVIDAQYEARHGGAKWDEQLTLNVASDLDAYNQAGWRVHDGTPDGLRFPGVVFDLAADVSLVNAWLGMSVGKRLAGSGVPAQLVPDGVDQLVVGYSERLAQFEWEITANCARYAPWKVGVLAATSGDTGEFVGRLVPDSMELMVARDTTQTSWTAATAPRFTTDSDDYPMDLRCSGEMLTATAASAVTASFVAVGTAAHADNAPVTPSLPASIAAGDLLLVLAAIRNTSFTANVPAGYMSIVDSTNQRLFAKIATASESAPTVTFTGGAAGDTCSAQMAAFRGVAAHPIASHAQNNGSAQDITTPDLTLYQIFEAANLVDKALVVAIAWKQDDWTGATSPASFTEIGDQPSTLGNDQGITWAYWLQGAASAVPASSFVITGGAAAISSSAVVALRSDVISLTVTRSVNAVVKSHPVGDTIEVEDPYVLAL